MIDVIQNGDVYEVSFKYDETLVEMMRQVPGKTWNPIGKFYTIPKEKLGMFINQFLGTPYESMVKIRSYEDLGVNDNIESTKPAEIPDVDLANVPQYTKPGCTPYNHQLDGLKYAIGNNQQGFILADEPGCGKTWQIFNYGLYLQKYKGVKHCLVICCKNGNKYNWVRDIAEHTQRDDLAYILGTRKLKRKSGFVSDPPGTAKVEDLELGHMYGSVDEPELPFFLITNIESIRLQSKRKYLFAEAIIKMINNGEIGLIAIDECHKNMSPQSTQGKIINKIKQVTQNKAEWIPMTGTPIVNNPLDVFTPLKLINGHNHRYFSDWSNYFCVFGGFGGYDVVGYRNIPELKRMLQTRMLRRLKSEVLDLPDKIPILEYVELTPTQKKLYKEESKELADKRELIINEPNPMKEFLRLRQVAGTPELIDESIKIDNTYISKNAKLKRLLELIDDAVQNNQKVIVYSNWTMVLKTLYTFISAKYKTACCFGKMKASLRLQHKEAFEHNPEYKVLIGTIASLGTGDTLTAANTIIFYDEPLTQADKTQAEDRAHRIGTTSSLNIYTLLAKDTIDEVVHGIVYDKGATSDFIVDDKLDLKRNPDLFNKLLLM